jgi:hypothetical protein
MPHQQGTAVVNAQFQQPNRHLPEVPEVEFVIFEVTRRPGFVGVESQADLSKGLLHEHSVLLAQCMNGNSRPAATMAKHGTTWQDWIAFVQSDRERDATRDDTMGSAVRVAIDWCCRS